MHDDLTLNDATSFDHFIGRRKQGRRHVESERLGGLEIDDEFEFCRLLDWDVCRLFAFQDFVNEFRRAPVKLPPVCAV